MKNLFYFFSFIFLVFARQSILAQDYADKSYYLIDSLDMEGLTTDDSLLLETSLSIYHSANKDTTRINAIGEICSNMMDNAWVKYQFFQMELIDRAMLGNVTESENNMLQKAQATALSNYGYIYQDLGEIEKALSYYDEAGEIQQQIDDQKGLGNTFNNIGTIYDSQGNVPKALEFYQRALLIRKETGDKKNLAGSFNNIGFIYMAQGDYDKALEYFLKAYEMFEEVGNKKGISFVVNNIGGIYFKQGNAVKAIVYYEKSLKIRREIGNKGGVANSLNNLGEMYRHQGKYEKAAGYYEEALAMFEEIGEKIGIAYVSYSIGMMYNDIEDIENGYLYALKSYQVSRELGFPNSQKKAANLLKYICVVQAKSFEKEGKVQKVASKYEEADRYALEVIDFNNRAILSNFSVLSEKGQEKYFKQVEPGYMSFNSYALMRKKSKPEIVNIVFDNIVKNKGLLLKSSTAMHNAVFNSGDTVLISNYKDWIELKKEIAKLYSKGKNTEALDEKANSIEKELVKRSQVFSEFKQLQNISWKDVQKGLKEGEAALEFVHFKYVDYSGDDFGDFIDSVMYCALVVTPSCKTPEMIPLFIEKELESVLGKFGGNNSSYIEKLYGSNAKPQTELYKMIWGPIESYLYGVKKVFVSPSGLLHKISFSALAKQKNIYLCDNYNIEIKSSSGKITEETKSTITDRGNNTSATVFGGITYDTDSTETKIWNYLAGTKTEIEQINKILKKGKVDVGYFSNSSATEEEFKHIASTSNILHIATHGFFYPDPNEIREEVAQSEEVGEINFRGGSRGFGVGSFVENPNPLMRSGLVFAGANDVWSKQNEDSLDDGVLTAQEVAHIDMRNTDLVVLSACETGLGDIKGSEGVYGLQRSFKMSGVKYIIMSLWQVPDKETSEFMTVFYKNLIKMNDVKKAFSVTQAQMRKKYDPYYWAAFELVE